MVIGKAKVVAKKKDSKKRRPDNHELTKRDIHEYIRICRDLCYPAEVEEAVKEAKSVFECERILKDARHKYS